MKGSVLVAMVMSVALAASAQAQFTAVVPPAPKKAAPPTKAQVVAHADSVSRQTLTDMKTWVDSAAASMGVAAADTSRDTMTVATTTTTSSTTTSQVTTERNGTVAFSEGAPAPSTATDEPFYFLLGAGTLTIGLVLLRRHA